MIYPNPQIYPQLKTIFVHVPKAAGTSIEKRLRQDSNMIVGGHTTALGFRKKYPEAFNEYYKFAVVRHPVSRFVSAFYYLLNQPVHVALDNEFVHECANLGDFARCVETKPDLLRKMVHFFPQHEFICDAQDRILVNDIYRFESLSEEWLRLCKRIGLTLAPLEVLNRSVREQTELADKARLVGLINEIYRKDFELFGYQSDIC